MSTRAFVGVRVQGNEYLQYNHSDGYPTSLGLQMVQAARALTLPALRAAALSWTLVDASDKPSEAQILKCHAHLAEAGESASDLLERLQRLSSRDEDALTWYWLLHDYQGDLSAWVERSIPVWPQEEHLPVQFDTEWGYLIDCDTETFEVYTNHYRDNATTRARLVKLGNPYAAKATEEDDKPVALIGSVPVEELGDLPERAVTAWLADLERRTDYRRNDCFVRHPKAIAGKRRKGVEA